MQGGRHPLNLSRRESRARTWGGLLLKVFQLLRVVWPQETLMTMNRQNPAFSLRMCLLWLVINRAPFAGSENCTAGQLGFPTYSISQKRKSPSTGQWELQNSFILCANPALTVLIKLKPGFHFSSWALLSFYILGSFDTIFHIYGPCSLERPVVPTFMKFRSKDHIISRVSMESA